MEEKINGGRSFFSNFSHKVTVKHEETQRKIRITRLRKLNLIVDYSGLIHQAKRVNGFRIGLDNQAPTIGGDFSKEFIILIVLANIMAWPIAYWAVDNWLQNFAFRIDIPVWIFALATVITFFTSFLAILFHTIKAAYTNPVNYLRYE